MINGISNSNFSIPLTDPPVKSLPGDNSLPTTGGSSGIGSGYTPASEALQRSTIGPNNTDLMGLPHQQSRAFADAQANGMGGGEIEALLEQLLGLLMQLLQKLDQGGQGAVTPNGGGSIQPESGGNLNSAIPDPTQDIQSFDLGPKTVVIGGDGSATAQEVEQTAQTLQQMYQSSPSFRDQIDNNPNQTLQIAVGKRADNTSWGGSDGRIFLNINNVSPTANDTFESLVSHEVGHTQGLGHGGQMEALESAVAAEV